MNTHEVMKQKISVYFDGETTPAEKKEVEEHLKACISCQNQLEAFKKISFSLESWHDADPSPDLDQKLAKIKNPEESKMKTKKTKWNHRAAAAVLAGLAAVVVFRHLGDRALEEPKPPAPITREVSVTEKAIAPAAAPSEVKPDRLFFAAEALKKSEPSAYQNFSVRREALLEFSFQAKEEEVFNTENYASIQESGFQEVLKHPLSTFSIDVDTASYSNVRRFLNQDQMPPKDAVRIEEMINYFTYDYPAPQGEEPFSITAEMSACPWNKEHELLLVGLRGKEFSKESLPESNLVFLIDVSGSMDEPGKLPLLQKAFQTMIQQLDQKQRVAIVTYAGASGLVLDSTPGTEKETLRGAIQDLTPGGATAGAEGIRLAYEIAQKHFISGGSNRVILATDGDFNVGVSSEGELVRLVEEKRASGVFLTVLGFGTGNYQDSKMEKLADKGNGNYFYIDSLSEARKVLVEELGSTLFTIAKDVKIQVEFNPGKVKAYRLVGYENRMLAAEDFNDDKKDAGEMGAGHTVTALYELVSADSKETFGKIDDLTYQESKIKASGDVATVKLRYKEPEGAESRLLAKTLTQEQAAQNPSGNLLWASAAAEFGMLLRGSEFKGSASYREVLNRSQTAKGQDPSGHRAEFIELVQKAQKLDISPSEGIQFKGSAE